MPNDNGSLSIFCINMAFCSTKDPKTHYKQCLRSCSLIPCRQGVRLCRELHSTAQVQGYTYANILGILDLCSTPMKCSDGTDVGSKGPRTLHHFQLKKNTNGILEAHMKQKRPCSFEGLVQGMPIPCFFPTYFKPQGYLLFLYFLCDWRALASLSSGWQSWRAQLPWGCAEPSTVF